MPVFRPADNKLPNDVWQFRRRFIPYESALPRVRDVGAVSSGAASITPAMPAHQSGDILVLVVETAGGEACTLTTANGFAAMSGSPWSTGTTTTGTRLSLFSLTATSSAHSSPVVADSGNHQVALIFSVYNTSAVDFITGGSNGSASTTTTITGGTSTANNVLVLGIATRDDDSASTTAFSNLANTNLAGLAKLTEAGATAGNGGGFIICYGHKVAAGAIGDITVTAPSSVSAFAMLGFAPLFVTAEASITEGADALSSDGSVISSAITAESAITEGAESVAANGSVLVSAEFSASEGADTQASAGSVVVSAGSAITEGAASVSSDGSVLVSGAVAISEGGDSVSASIASIIPSRAGTGAGVASFVDASPAWPTHAANDIGFLIVQTAGGQAAVLSTPAGFQAVDNSPQSTGTGTAGTRLTVFWCRATSSSMPSPVIADTGNHVLAKIVTYADCATTGNPWYATQGSVKGTASTSNTIPGPTTPADLCRIVVISARDVDFFSNAVFSGWANAGLSGLSEWFEDSTNFGAGGGIAIADGIQTTAGSGGNTTVNLTQTAVAANLVIALRGQIETGVLNGGMTEGADTVSSAASAIITASAGLTEAPDTVSSTVQDDDLGDTLVSDVQVFVSADVAKTEAADGISSTATVDTLPVLADAAITESPDDFTSSGVLPIGAHAFALIESDDHLSAAYTVLISASASIAEGADTVSAVGYFGPRVYDLSVSESPDVVSADGGLTILANASIGEDTDSLVSDIFDDELGDILSASATVTINGDGSPVESPDTLSSTATTFSEESLFAVFVVESPDDFTASASVLVRGNAIFIQEGPDSVSSAYQAILFGNAPITEANDTSSSTAVVDISASSAIQESGDTLDSGTLAIIYADSSIAEGADTLSSGAWFQQLAIADASITEGQDDVNATFLLLDELFANLNLGEGAESSDSDFTVQWPVLFDAAISEGGDSVSADSIVRTPLFAEASIQEGADSIEADFVFGVIAEFEGAIAENSDTAQATATVIPLFYEGAGHGGPDDLMPFERHAHEKYRGRHRHRRTIDPPKEESLPKPIKRADAMVIYQDGHDMADIAALFIKLRKVA